MNAQNIEQVLLSEGKFVCTTSGISMMPLFADRRDTVVILPKKARLKKYDVALYRRGEKYVLHRVIKVLPDSYIIRGDNCEAKETGIRDEDVIGVLFAFYRKDKYFEVTNTIYRIYSFFIVAAFPFLSLFRRVKRKIFKFIKNRDKN